MVRSNRVSSRWMEIAALGAARGEEGRGVQTIIEM